MIDPANQWAIQIEVTNACQHACSNCTRFVGHHQKPFFVTLEDFRRAAIALADFPTNSRPSPPDVTKITGGAKMVGMLGGEPLLHPEFAELVAIFMEAIPRRENRGLWTGMRWERSKYAPLIEEAFGYINNNRHDSKCLHSPILVAIKDIVGDPQERQRMIDACWLQRMWSSSITPKGFFFCEVAGAFDLLFDGPGGLPVEPGCWRRPLSDFQDQIDRWCWRCGIPMEMKGRIDKENIDDISPTNLSCLKDSPRISAGKYILRESIGESADRPWQYLQ
jgi:hypothetical protein